MTLDYPQSETELCNGALALLGIDDRLTDVESDASVNARRCRLALPRVREALLAGYPWNFAARRARLTAWVSAPPWGFLHQYALPADFVRMRSLREERPGERYAVEAGPAGRMLLSDRPAPLDILYTARLPGVISYDGLFLEALTVRLAADLAMPVTQTRTLFETLHRLAAVRLEEAQAADAREGSPAEGFPAGSWAEARL